MSKRAAPGDQAKDHCQGGDKSKRLNPIFHKSSRSQAAHPCRVSKLRAITSSRLAAALVRREKEIGFARLSERSSGSPDAQFRHCFFPTTLDAVVESPALSGVSRTTEHFLLTQKKTIPCDTKPTGDFLLHYVDHCRWGTRPSDRISGTKRDVSQERGRRPELRSVAAGNECVALPEHGSKPAQVTYRDTKARTTSSPTIAQNAILISR